jgi:hypothetical protein
MACRQLAWSTRVRVKGERLFEQVPGRGAEYRGEHIELLELPEVTPATCRLETLEVAGHVWMAAASAGEMLSAGDAASFPREPPCWISLTPVAAGWLHAAGAAALSFKDEPSRWTPG